MAVEIKRAVRVNIEIVYDDGTLDEVALDPDMVTVEVNPTSRHPASFNEVRVRAHGLAVDP